MISTMQRENHLLGEFHEKVVEELAADDEGTRTSSLELYEALNNISLDRNSSADPPPMFPQYSSSILPSRGPNVFGMDNDIGLFGVETSNSFPPALHSMPDLHRHHYNDIPRAAASFCTASNSSPDMQFPLERMMPSSYGMGMRKLDKSMRFLLNRQSVEKKGFQCELDMNLPFPAKLHYILSNPKYKDCVAWLPHGRAWRILKPKTFEKKVIPKFFRSFKYASFMRQVNGWAFNRITEGPDLNAYYHEMFLRGIPTLCFQMKRPPKVKNAAATARYASGAGSGTPDFYRIAKIAPLPPATAFRPVVRESKVDGDGPRYEIEPLDLKAENNFLDEMPMIGWGSAEQPLSDATIFSDPSAEDTKDSADTVLLHGQSKTTDSSTHSEDYTHSGDSSMDNSKDGHGRQQNVSLADEKADKNNPLSSLEANVDTASHDRADTDTKTEIEFEKLSTADLAYLAHQNRILLKHAETGINKDGTMRQKHKI